MSAGLLPLEVNIGLPISIPLDLLMGPNEPADLTGCTFVAGIRPRAGVDPLIPLTVTIVSAAEGRILISAPAEATEALILDSYAWDLIITGPDPEDVPVPILKGPITKVGVISIPTP